MVERFLVTDRTVLHWIKTDAGRTNWGRLLADRLEKYGGLTEREIAFTRQNVLHIPDRITRRRIIAQQKAYETLKRPGPRNRLSRAIAAANKKRWELRKEARDARRAEQQAPAVEPQ